MAEAGQNIIIDRVPLTIYYDSERALAKDRTQAGSWSIQGPHKVFRKIVRGNQTVYSIYNNTGAYVIGWIRAEDVTDPSTLPPPDPEDPEEPEEPEIIPDMTLEKDGETINLFYGSNADKDLVLHPGINRIKIKGKGVVRFHWHDEVMG